MKFLLANLSVLILMFSAFGQNAADNEPPCTNQTVEKISSRGISLGMSQQETLNLFAENGKLTTVSSEYLQNEGRNKYTNNEAEFQNVVNALKNRSAQMFGFSSTSLAPGDKIKFDGIDHYDLGFLDNRLAFFRTYYTKPKWENSEQFIRKMSEILSLPVRENDLNNGQYQVKCGNHTVQLSRENAAGEDYYTMLVSANINEIIRERRKKADDEQREKDIKVFKP